MWWSRLHFGRFFFTRLVTLLKILLTFRFQSVLGVLSVVGSTESLNAKTLVSIL
jgi:fumarate reductase subunit C